MSKKTEEFKLLLTSLHACSGAVSWADGKTLKQAWRTCERADWMLWLVGRMKDKQGWPTHQQVVLAACGCAETALKFVPEGEERPKIAIETAQRWCKGEATTGEVANAAHDAANAAYYAANDAAHDAYAVANGAYAAANGAYAVANGAYAAAYYAANAVAVAYYAANAANAVAVAYYAANAYVANAALAKLVRKQIPIVGE